MHRMGTTANRATIVFVAGLLAIVGAASVFAQTLGPAGPSPATDNAAVVAQSILDVTDGQWVWRIRNVPVGEEPSSMDSLYPAFLTTEGVPVVAVDPESGSRQRIAAGEATELLPGNEITIASLGPAQAVTIIDLLPASAAVLTGATGSISLPFQLESGTYDVDMIRVMLAERDTTIVPAGSGPSQIIALTGQAEVETSDGSFSMAGGSDRIAEGELAITANADDTVLLIIRIGPDIPLPAASTPEASSPEAATPKSTPQVATPAEPTATATAAGVVSTAAAVPTRAPTEAPEDRDSDGDGIGNADEIAAGTNPDSADTDDDGIDDGDELALGTDPANLDSDGDLLYDGGELIFATDPLNPDTDGDGLTDGEEVYFFETDPTLADTNGNGVNDFDESRDTPEPTEPATEGGSENDADSPPNNADTDNDGLLDRQEPQYGTDPLKNDTDGDGVNDSNEVAAGTDPLDDQSYP